MSFLIRDATLDDAADIFSLLVDARLHAYKSLIAEPYQSKFLQNNQVSDRKIEAFRQGLAKKLEKPETYILKVLVDGNKICGYSAARRSSDGVYLSKLHIHPLVQGKGYGSALLEYMLSLFKQENISLHVLEENKKAMKLYEKYSFKQSADSTGYYGLKRVLMIKTENY